MNDQLTEDELLVLAEAFEGMVDAEADLRTEMGCTIAHDYTLDGHTIFQDGLYYCTAVSEAEAVKLMSLLVQSQWWTY